MAQRFELQLAGGIAARLVIDPSRTPLRRPPLLCCFAGGAMTSGYFDLPRPYGMAERLAGRGLPLLLVDHPGTGGSEAPAESSSLVPEVVAEVEGTAVAEALDRFRAGTLASGLRPRPDVVPIGLGHSMGAMLVALQQARFGLYDGLVLLGHSGRGLPEEERTGVELVGSDLPADAAEALASVRAPLLEDCGRAAITAGSHDEALAAIDVPTFLGLAEHDIAGVPQEAPRWLTGCRDLTLHVLAGAHHNANVAPSRVEQWDRVAGWAERLAQRVP